MNMRRLLVLIMLLGSAGCDGGGPGLLAPGETAPLPAPNPSATDADSDGPSDCTSPKDVFELHQQLLRLINIERFDVGMVELDPDLSAIAARYACEMIDDGFFGHVHPKTEQGIADRVEDSGYEYDVVGENLAAGYWNPYEVIDAWMASAAHRDILLDPAFTHVGLAVRYGGEYGIYFVLILADVAD